MVAILFCHLLRVWVDGFLLLRYWLMKEIEMQVNAKLWVSRSLVMCCLGADIVCFATWVGSK